jgi:rhamnose transport system ATP-binding protein
VSVEPWLSVRRLTKGFHGVQALHDVDFEVRQGEVHGLVGQNGAGKSTLIKVLAGAYRPDSGTIVVDGIETKFADTSAATAAGIAVLHQEPQVIADMPVYENVYLGLRPPRAGVIIRRGAMRRATKEMLSRLEVELDVDAPVSDLSQSQTQMVGLARCMLQGARVIIMDEPTASLGAHEVEQVYRTVARLSDSGVSVLYVSHRLDEIAALCDRATVLRDGELVGELTHEELQDRQRLVRMILGVEPSQLVRATEHRRGEVALHAEGLSWKGRVKDANLTLYRGEVTGLVGLVGSGRSELAHLLFGAHRPERGRIEVGGRRMKASSPAQAIRRGVALVPEDRKNQGSFADWSVRENLTLAAIDRFSRFGLVRRGMERAHYRVDRDRLSIKAAGADSKFGHLSGGNQQKVAIAKWLATDADVLIFDEPTQGVDVGAQEEIHRLVREIAHQDRAVMFISSDLAETHRVSDRLVVMREGRIVAEADPAQTSMEEVVSLCFGVEYDPLSVVR